MLQGQIDQVRASLDSEQQKRQSIQMQILSLQNRLHDLVLNQESARSRKDQLKDELARYVLDHKMASAALLATGAGAAAVLQDDLDEDTRNILGTVGVIGVGYCLFNAEECVEVGTKVAYYGTEMDSAQKRADSLQTDIAQVQQSISGVEASLQPVEANISARERELADLQRQYQAL